MSSQISGIAGMYEWHLFVRGYHVYRTLWTPVSGEILQLRNDHDNYAVAVVKSDQTIGHVPQLKR